MLTKDDIVYYKVHLQQLFKEAKVHGIRIDIKDGAVTFFNKQTGEITQVLISKLQQ